MDLVGGEDHRLVLGVERALQVGVLAELLQLGLGVGEDEVALLHQFDATAVLQLVGQILHHADARP